MGECVFCKIVSGSIPAHKVYEDEKTLAFLDLHPIQPGHSLVISKIHQPHFEQLEQDNYDSVMGVVKKLAQKQKQVFGAKRVCVRVEGFDVEHTHVHVYPCNAPEEFYGSSDRMTLEPDHEEQAKIAKKLYFE